MLLFALSGSWLEEHMRLREGFPDLLDAGAWNAACAPQVAPFLSYRQSEAENLLQVIAL